MNEFLSGLRNSESEEALIDFCRKQVLHGCPFVFKANEEALYDFRKMIAAHFQVNFLEIYITGSAKLGFSPHKGTIFSLESDVDVAIVSEKLFTEIMDQIHTYQLELRKGRKSISEAELKQYHTFLEYTALGWIRPDKLPTSFKIITLKDNWFNFFRSISNGKSSVGNYEVKAGVFKTYSHLERYLIEGYKQLQNQLKVKETHDKPN